jgi:transposase
VGRSAAARIDVQKKTLKASEQDRPDVAAARAAWPSRVASWLAAGRRLIFLDETGAKTDFTRLRGWAPKGERRHAKAPFAHWHSTTMAAAVTAGAVVAAFVYPGATDGAAFATFATAVLLPELRPGDVVILDNLAAHRHAAVHQRFAEAGVEIAFLPPYSPDLNPIENVFSKIKTLLRRAEARTFDALTTAIGRILERVTTADTANTIRHAGYGNNNQ